MKKRGESSIKDGNGNGKDTFVWAYHDQTAVPSL